MKFKKIKIKPKFHKIKNKTLLRIFININDN